TNAGFESLHCDDNPLATGSSEGLTISHHRSKEGTQGCEACWLRFESSRWYEAQACTDRPPVRTRGAVFAGRRSSVTGLIPRGRSKDRPNPSPAACPPDCSPCWCTVTAHTRVRESSILSTATNRCRLPFSSP